MTAFLIIVGVTFLLLVLRSRIIGLQVLVACLPLYLERFSIGAIPFTLLELLIAVVVFVGVVDFARNSNVRKRFAQTCTQNKAFLGFVLLFLVAGTLAVFVAQDTEAALGIWKAYIIEPALLLGVFVLWIQQRAQLDRVLLALMLAATVIAGYGLMQLGSPALIPEPWNDANLLRITSVFEYPNALGLYLGPILVLTLGVLWKDSFRLKKTRFWLVIPAIVIALALVFSKSQGAIVGVAGAVFVWGLFTRYRWRWVALAVFSAVVVVLVDGVRDVLWPVLTLTDVSGEVRRVLWLGSWRLIADNWLMGVGLSGFPAAYDMYREARHVELLQYPHNIVLNFWVEMGLLGVVSVVGLFGAAFASIQKHWKNSLAIVGFGMLLAMLVHGLVDAPFFKNDLAVLWWITFFVAVIGPKLTSSPRG